MPAGKAVLAVTDLARMAEEELQVADWNDLPPDGADVEWVVGVFFFLYSCDSGNCVHTDVVGHISHASQSNWMCPNDAVWVL
jgi:hypothetical protein